MKLLIERVMAESCDEPVVYAFVCICCVSGSVVSSEAVLMMNSFEEEMEGILEHQQAARRNIDIVYKELKLLRHHFELKTIEHEIVLRQHRRLIDNLTKKTRATTRLMTLMMTSLLKKTLKRRKLLRKMKVMKSIHLLIRCLGEK